MQAQPRHSVVALSEDRAAAEFAVKKLRAARFALNGIGIVGQGYQTEEMVTGLDNMGDREPLWRSRGPFWGGLSALGGARARIGAPRDAVLGYWSAITADSVKVMARAEGVLQFANPPEVDLHSGGLTSAAPPASADRLAGVAS